MTNYCRLYWGSHGCDKPAGHEAEGDPIHQCGVDVEDGPCSEFIVLGPETEPGDITINGAVRFFVLHPDGSESWDDEWLPSHWFT